MNSSAYLATLFNYVHDNSVILVDPTIVHFVLFLFGYQQFSISSTGLVHSAVPLCVRRWRCSASSSCILLKVYLILKGARAGCSSVNEQQTDRTSSSHSVPDCVYFLLLQVS